MDSDECIYWRRIPGEHTMPVAEREPVDDPAAAHAPAAAGEIAGAIAGATYLLVQMSIARGAAVAPLQRIAAMVLGPEAALPPAQAGLPVLALALVLHFALAVVYGRFVCTLVWQRRVASALLLGAASGVALYGLNFELLAPTAFPWFAAATRLATLADHALFGALAAAVCLLLRRRTD
jgi:hypothetical protein